MSLDSASPPPSELSARRADVSVRWLDRGVALLLSLGYLVGLVATLDIGYTRDESYYFKYGQVYMDWFTALGEDARDGEWGRSLEREPVVRAWSNNFEHPPLMKTLFGWSWALFAEKIRPLGPFRFDGGETGQATVPVQELGASDGFAEGAHVRLLPAALVGETPQRTVALRAEVVERRARRAVVRVDAPPDEVRRFAARCVEANRPDKRVQRGCTALEDRSLAVLGEGDATRLPALLFAAALIGLIYLFGLRLGGRVVGAFAAIAFAALPRGFFHAHLCAFDVPVVTMMLATLYAFWRAEHSRAWAAVTGIVWGFALLTKHNAMFLPVTLVVYWLLAHGKSIALPRVDQGTASPWPAVVVSLVLAVGLTVAIGLVGLVLALCALPVLLGRSLRLPALPSAFLWMPLLGLPLLFVLWPKLWFDPFRAFRDYVSFHLSHEHYMQYYFGQILEVPPFPVAYPFVLTALTVPILTLLAFLGGSAVVYVPSLVDGVRWLRLRARRSPRESAPPADAETRAYGRRVRVFVAVNLLFPILLIALPKTPIFGGVKHWLTAMPFFAIVAGFGFDRLRRWLAGTLRLEGRPILAGAFGVALFAVVLLPAGVETWRAHPHGTAYYNGLIGCVQGAADHRMHRQFWGYATRQTFPRLNREAPHGARVFFQNTTFDAFAIYRRDGLLRPDLRYAWGPEGADIALMEQQKSFAELEMKIWDELGTVGSAWQETLEGVPVIHVYLREPARPTAP